MIIRCRILAFFLVLLLLGGFQELSGQENLGKLSCVCIDAGHGGVDPGAVSGKIKEKDITLAIALKLGELIRKNYPDIKIVYTRKKDVAVDLRERGRIANKAKAQLFISIHVNKFKNSSVKGVETFVLGLHKSQASLQVAMKENEAIHYEEDYTVKYDGFDPQKTESYILFNLMKSAFLTNSLELATPVQKELVSGLKMNDREVKQAGFIVLMDVAMPAVLIETGFLSNSEDLKVLTSDSGQNNIAGAIFRGFRSYKEKMERNSVVIKNTPPREADTETNVEAGRSLFYAIQIASSKNRMTDLKRFKLDVQVEELKMEDRYRYVVCKCSSYQEAVKLQQNIRKNIKDCFIIAVLDGNVISVADARKMETGK